MTLNAVIALILRFFTKFDKFSSRLYHSGWRWTYNIRKILSLSSTLPLLAKTVTHPAARSLCDSWASCLLTIIVRVTLTSESCLPPVTAPMYTVSKETSPMFVAITRESIVGFSWCLVEILLRKQAIKRCYIFLRHLINVSALPCKTENTENVCFHVNVPCWFAIRHTSHIRIIT